MKKIFIDGSTMKSVNELHAEIREKLSFPDHYGDNLDALWDCISEGAFRERTLVWKDFEICRNHLGDYAMRVWQTLKDAEAEGYVRKVQRE